MADNSNFIPQQGYYRNLRAYQLAEIIYDVTYLFTCKYLDRKDRTVDQMVQAARSGKQNIAEGSAAGVTSKETEIKLTNVAKASLQELLIDYEDYLRVRGMEKWDAASAKVMQTRNYCRTQKDSTEICRKLQTRSAETTANIAISLIHQADRLLHGLIERQKRDFLQKGGIREQMSKARREYRSSTGNYNYESKGSTGSTGSTGSSEKTGSPGSPGSPSAPSAHGAPGSPGSLTSKNSKNNESR